MSEILGGVGSVVEGGLLSRALEPDSGAKEPHPNQPENCLNCGTKLEGAYCHACGQQGHIHRTIGAFGHDLLHGALHLEGKLWRTLPMLAFKPGALTRRYVEGERARFVSPMALFLFGVFLMFAVFQMVGFTAPTDLPGGEAVESNIADARANARAEIERLQERLATDDLSPAERAELENEMALLNQLVLGTGIADEEGVSDAAADGSAEGIDAGQEEDTGQVGVVAGGDISDQASIVRADFSDLAGSDTGVGWLDTVIHKWRDNPSLMLYKLQANAYKFSWLLIPISIPFVWLLFFWKRRFRGYDHAIFVTYSLSFMTLLFILASVLGQVGVPFGFLITAVLIIPPIHLYKQLRGAYQLRRFSAFWRLMMLSLFIWVIVFLFIQVLLLLGLF
ncbi:DUF3667 domain-containing protein [Aurantiacibacter gilvus]|uniref:DUF3667 domain-containing protein n=1 Tax=Aurantiacibacter gilvus TaxID=3139141 RepID=A0ABU9I9N5_9SPHN